MSSNRRRRSILKSSRNSCDNSLNTNNVPVADETANLTELLSVRARKRVSFGQRQVKEFQLQSPSPESSPVTMANKTLTGEVDMDLSFGDQQIDKTFTCGGNVYEDQTTYFTDISVSETFRIPTHSETFRTSEFEKPNATSTAAAQLFHNPMPPPPPVTNGKAAELNMRLVTVRSFRNPNVVPVPAAKMPYSLRNRKNNPCGKFGEIPVVTPKRNTNNTKRRDESTSEEPLEYQTAHTFHQSRDDENEDPEDEIQKRSEKETIEIKNTTVPEEHFILHRADSDDKIAKDALVNLDAEQQQHRFNLSPEVCRFVTTLALDRPDDSIIQDKFAENTVVGSPKPSARSRDESISEELLEHQTAPTFHQLHEDESEDEIVSQKENKNTTVSQEDFILHRADNDDKIAKKDVIADKQQQYRINLTPELYNFVTTPDDSGIPNFRLVEHLMQEIIDMPSPLYEDFKHRFQNSFVPLYWAAFDVHRRRIATYGSRKVYIFP